MEHKGATIETPKFNGALRVCEKAFREAAEGTNRFNAVVEKAREANKAGNTKEALTQYLLAENTMADTYNILYVALSYITTGTKKEADFSYFNLTSKRASYQIELTDDPATIKRDNKRTIQYIKSSLDMMTKRIFVLSDAIGELYDSGLQAWQILEPSTNKLEPKQIKEIEGNMAVLKKNREKAKEQLLSIYKEDIASAGGELSSLPSSSSASSSQTPAQSQEFRQRVQTSSSSSQASSTDVLRG
jgi:hypothetical protein